MAIDRRMVGKIGEAILTTVAVAGVLTIAIAVPNAANVLGKMLHKQSRQKHYYFKQKLAKLIKQGMIKRIRQADAITLELTEKGKQALHFFSTKKPHRPKRWDGKWRLVMFDVWESSRTKRDRLRRELKIFGFVQLQQSIWIYPFDCEEYITLLRTELRFGSNIRYVVATYIDGEDRLLKKFDIYRP